MALVLGFVLTVAPLHEARGAGGELLWEDRGGGAGPVYAVAAQPGQVFAGGGGIDWSLRAYDSATGRLLWQDRYDGGGIQDYVGAVSAYGGTVFAAGTVSTFGGHLSLLVRAYDSSTGALRWQDLYDSRGGLVFGSAIVAVGSRVIVAGAVADSHGWDFLVRAYDGRTGGLLWQDRYDSGGGFDQAYAITASANRVFVAGIGGPFENPDVLVRAYDATNGRLLWHDRHDVSGATDWANEIAVYGDRVAVAARGTDAAGHLGFLVRAYDTRSGQPAWQDFVPGGEALAITVNGRLMIAAGHHSGSPLVRAYDAISGALRWESAHTGEFGSAEAIAASGGQVVVGGEHFTIDPNGEDRSILTVRAYDARTGRLAWEKEGPSGTIYTYTFALAAYGGRVFTGGSVDGHLIVDAWEAN